MSDDVKSWEDWSLIHNGTKISRKKFAVPGYGILLGLVSESDFVAQCAVAHVCDRAVRPWGHTVAQSHRSRTVAQKSHNSSIWAPFWTIHLLKLSGLCRVVKYALFNACLCNLESPALWFSDLTWPGVDPEISLIKNGLGLG